MATAPFDQKHYFFITAVKYKGFANNIYILDTKIVFYVIFVKYKAFPDISNFSLLRCHGNDRSVHTHHQQNCKQPDSES